MITTKTLEDMQNLLHTEQLICSIASHLTKLTASKEIKSILNNTIYQSSKNISSYTNFLEAEK